MKLAAIWALLLVAVVSAQAVDLIDVVEGQGLTRFANLLKLVDAYDVANNPDVVATLLAPTNEAIATFLSSMGLTSEDAMKRPDMVDTILGYHVIPYKKGLSRTIAPGSYGIASTVDPLDPVYMFKNKDGSLEVEDMQGNRAKVLKADLDAGKSVVYVIDRVLMNENVYFNIADALNSEIDIEWNTLASVAKALPSSMQAAFKNPKTEITLFAPSNAAFKKLPGALSLPQTTLVNVLTYHATPGYKEAPEGFRSGEKFATLFKGHSLGARVEIDPSDKNLATTYILPEVGGPVPIVYSNTWAGKSIIQGIDSVLLPSGMGTSEKGAVKPKGRHLLQSSRGVYRNDFSRWNSNSVRAPTAQRATQDAIRQAATGRAPASYATATGAFMARETTSRGNCWTC